MSKTYEQMTELEKASRLNDLVKFGWPLEKEDRGQLVSILTEWIGILKEEEVTHE